MGMDNQRIIILILKHLRQELSEEEKNELEDWINASERNVIFFRRCTAGSFIEEELEALDQLEEENVWDNKKVWAAIRERPVSEVTGLRALKWTRYIAAASIIIIIGIVIYRESFFSRPAITGEKMIAGKSNPVIPPGGNRAVLQMANGAIISLDSVSNGIFAQQGNASIIKQDSGQLVYRADTSAGAENLYNTILTPRGGQYEVVLADGSKVWLNAASSLRFPASFSGHLNRDVELSGEAYFEVAKNKGQPFHVKTTHGGKAVEIEVLGTHFNVMAYKDESICKTTLLEGAVKVSNDAGSALLQPGQQAQIVAGGTLIKIIKEADVQQATAWKEGLFEFQGEDIHAVMRQLSRWYDIDVQYADVISSHFMGTISRNVNASEVFGMLQMTGAVKFTGKNNLIIVSH